MNSKIISGSFLIAGTTIGAGMLGIPLLTATGGFWPAAVVTFIAWGLMLITGLLFLEATLWMPAGSNLLSMSERFLGKRGRLFSGVMFLFLYYCLLIAYFAAGAPMLGTALSSSLGLTLPPVALFALFGLLFSVVIAAGAKWIDRTNLILTCALVLSYLLLMAIGLPNVTAENLVTTNWPKSIFAMPILFSAFGYHNIIPSLATYFEKDTKSLKQSIYLGTFMAFVIYVLWQWLVIGIIPIRDIALALEEGSPVTASIRAATGNIWILWSGQAFAFFAITTSLLGVSFSMVDFLADGMKVDRQGLMRVALTLIVFIPPFIFATLYPAVFDKALGVAGGIGEAILNGIIPAALVYVGRYNRGLKPVMERLSSRPILSFITITMLIVMVLELYNMINGT